MEEAAMDTQRVGKEGSGLVYWPTKPEWIRVLFGGYF